MYRILARSGVGIAPYTGRAPWSYYCDPMKIHDYLAGGLPVVSTNVSALVQEVVAAGAGELFYLDSAESLAQAVLKIMADPATLRQYRKKALRLAQNYDKDKILKKRLSKFL